MDSETVQLPAENTRPAADRYLALTAAGITWIISAYRVSPSSLWDSDYRVVQCLSGQAIGWDGILTAMVSRGVLLLPLGTEVTRLALVSAAATALCSWLCYRMCFFVLSSFRRQTTSHCWLSFGMAILFGLSCSTQLAATLPPGPSVALAALLGIVFVALVNYRTFPQLASQVSQFFLLGVLVAVTLLEQLSVGAFALVALAQVVWTRRSAYDKKAFHEGVFGLLSALVAFGLPWFLTRRTVLSQALNSGIARSISPFGWLTFTPRYPSSLTTDLGLVLLLLSLLGCSILLASRKRKEFLWIFVLTLPQFFFEPGASTAPFAECLQLVGIVGLLLLSTLGLLKAIEWSGKGRKSPRLLAQSLAVIIQITLALAHTDEAAFRTDRYRSMGMDVFTDEALAGLPARSVLLLRDNRLYRRVVAAQFAEGLRPDLLPVPMEAATNQAIVSDLLPREPALAAVLRELAINGRPSEFALSTLADERPVYVEFDAEWDRRLREHLVPLPFLSRLYSQALGRSDRAIVLKQSEQQISRAFTATTLVGSSNVDPYAVAPMEQVTRAVLRARVEEQLTILLGMGDRKVFDLLFAEYEKFEPNSDFSKRIRPRLARSEKSIDAFDLLRPASLNTPPTPPVASR